MVAAGIVVAALLVSAGTSGAAFPGDSGLLIYTEVIDSIDSYRTALRTVDPADPQPSPFTDSTRAMNAAWSPDGKRVAYDDRADNGQAIWVSDAGAKSPEQVTSPYGDSYGYSSGWQANPAWSPDGRKLAFAAYYSDYGYTSSSIAVLDLESRTTTVLVDADNSMERNEEPVWSPDGSVIAFVSDRTGVPEIWAVRSSGGDPRQVTERQTPKGQLDWSPDGRVIVYEEGTGEAAELVALNVSTEVSHRLTENDIFDGQPAWSPDGEHIAFVTGRGQAHREIRTMTLDRTVSEPIIESNADIFDLNWQAVRPPPEPTTEPTTTTVDDTTTTTRATRVFGRSATNPTLPTPTPEDGAPALALDRPVARTGTVVVASGVDFPALALVTLRWEPGLGEVIVGADVEGELERSVLVMPRDALGPRRLVAYIDGVPVTDAPLLVVAGPYQPSGNTRSLITRR